MGEIFLRAKPQEMGVDPDGLCKLYEYLADPARGIHSFMVTRHARVVSQAYWAPYAPQKPHTLFSGSKSFTGLAVGFAVQDGLLSVEDTVVSFFPERLVGKPCENMLKMKVKHLLTMSPGFAKDPHDFPWPRPDDILATGPHCCHQGRELPRIDWIQNFFNHYVAYEPGKDFVYCTHGSYMLSVIVQRAVGKTVSEYLNEKLFLPLGIGTPYWEISPDGYNVGGWGLSLTTEQYAAVGQFLLNRGRWNGKQLLGEQWVQQATTVHMTMAHLDEPHMAGYGYQLWIDERENCFCFRGAFGQVCAVIPGKDMTITFTGGTDNAQRRVMWEKIWELVVNRVADSPIAVDEKAQAKLQKLERTMGISMAEGTPSWENKGAAAVSGKRYLLGENRLNFTSFSVKFAEKPNEPDELTLGLAGKEFTVPVGHRRWLRGETCVKTADTDTDVSVIFEKVSCTGAWREGSYHMVLCFDETSYINEISATFLGNSVILHHSRNCSFFEATTVMLTGVCVDET